MIELISHASQKAQFDFLAEYDVALENKKYPLVKHWMNTEPLAFFQQLREERPVLATPECTLVARFDDVRDLLQMPKIFSTALYKDKMGVTKENPGYLMAHDDDALHYREKSIMQGMLNKDDLPRVRRLVSESAVKILNSADGELELIENYCRAIPAQLVAEYFGLDGVEKERLIDWSRWNQYDAFHNQPFDLTTVDKSARIISEHNRVTEELSQYIKRTIARKLTSIKADTSKNPIFLAWKIAKLLFYKAQGKSQPKLKDDIFSRMLRSKFDENVDFDIERVGVNAGGLLIGSIETSSQAVAQVIEFIINEPKILAQAKNAASARTTNYFDNLVWEALRFVPISPYLFRKASQDYVLARGTEHETLIREGTNVLALTQSAMFDSNAYDRPEEFNPNRNWYHHFNYGFGSHECLGKYIGMEMIPEMVRQIIRLPSFEVLAPLDYKGGPFPEMYPVKWGN